MGKRQKTVFSSHAELCHIWAHQAQDRGRAGNMFFERQKIYSYGYHFLAAEIHRTPIGPIALINSLNYSASTRKHLSHIQDALRGYMPSFRVPKPDKLRCKENREYFMACIHSEIDTALKRVKVEDSQIIAWSIENIQRQVDQANEYLRFIGAKPYSLPNETLDKVKAHLAKRLARYHELNTPEMKAVREKERLKREEKRAKVTAAKLAEAITRFRNGETVWSLRELTYDLLRVDGDEVVTSRNARVPLRAATTLLRALLTGKDIVGKHLGPFTVDRVIPITDLHTGQTTERVIKIGCHVIRQSEALAVLGTYLAVGAA